jgi:hypothetical protein
MIDYRFIKVECYLQLISLPFLLKQLSLVMFTNTGDENNPLMKFVIEMVGLDMVTHQFDTSIVAYIGRIYLQLCQFHGMLSVLLFL